MGAAGACSQSDFTAGDGDGGTDSGGGDDFTVNGSDTGSGSESGGSDTGGGGTDAVADVNNVPDRDAAIDDVQIIQPDADGGCTDVPSDTLGAAVALGGTGNPTTGCTVANPCGTITDGIAYAMNKSLSLVYVSDGAYNERVLLDKSTLTASSPRLTIQGGWHRDPASHVWQNCSKSFVDIVGPAGSVGTVVVSNAPLPITLDHLKIASRVAVLNVGDSVYGILVSGSSDLTLESVVVDAQNAGTGPNGSAGGGGAAPPGSCAPGGTTAPPGASGTAGQLGAFGPNGYTPVTAGTGGAGGQGANGTANGKSAPICNPNCFDKTACVQDSSCGNHLKTVCGADGIPGCGSGGGGPGTGGGGGGSSVAVYVWGNATVTANYTILTGYVGGNGGNGGGGGTAPAPSAGQAGAAASCTINANCMFQPPPNDTSCMVQGGTIVSQAGGAGSTGSAGSPGGAGGGGAGGYSYGYFKGTGATFKEGDGFVASSKGPGAGGTGGNPGVSGVSGAHN